MKDCWHFITKDNLIFTTRGDNHPRGYILSVGLYYPDEKGDREYSGLIYSKKVDEYGDKWVKLICPGYVRKNNLGDQILVPVEDIDKFFDPFLVSQETREIIKRSKWGALIKILEEIIPQEDIGLIGSYLIGFPTMNSDIDIILRGVDNMEKIRNNFKLILKKLNATNDLDNLLKEISLNKYNKLYSPEKNDFSRMIQNRWPTIRTREYVTKLRFVPKEGEIIFPDIKNKVDEIEIKGEVINDLGTNFMPRFFKIKTETGLYFVLTYFWDYTYCVKKGDNVKVRGFLFDDNIIMINDRKKHGILFN